MRKFYLFLLVLLTSFCATNKMVAQTHLYNVDETSPLITDASQLSSPWTDTGEGTNIGDIIDGDAQTFWHSSWHGTPAPPHDIQGSHYFQVEMPDNYYTEGMRISFKFTRRAVYGNHITKWKVMGTNEAIDYTDENNKALLEALYKDPLADKATCTVVANITTPYEGYTKPVVGEPFDPQGFKYLRFYGEDTEGDPQHDGQAHLVFWHLAEFQLYPATENSELKTALLDLKDIHDEYVKYTKNNYFTTGDNPGDFDKDTVQVFIDAVNAANVDVDNYNGSDDIEDIKALGEAVKTAYEAIWPTLKPIEVEAGYYRIRTGATYYETRKDEDDLESDIYPEKYMRAKLDGSTYKVIWDTPDDLDTDGSALWKVTPTTDGRYDIMNAGYKARFDTIATSTQATLSKTSTNEMVITPMYTDDDGITYVNLNVYPQKINGKFCIHQAGHNYVEDEKNEHYGYGSGKKGNVVGWSSTFDREKKRPKGSEWFFEPVDEEEALVILEEFDGIAANEELLEKYDSIMANAKEKLAIAGKVGKKSIIDKTRPLISNNNQFSSPYTETAEGLGKVEDGEDSNPKWEQLFDGEISTFWHSTWKGGNVAMDTHYLQVEINESDLSTLENAAIVIGRRSVRNDHVTGFNVRGTNTADADKNGCTLLAEIEMPFGGAGELDVISSGFPVQGFKYLRFYPTSTISLEGASYNNRGYFHLAEFQIYPATIEITYNAQSDNMGNLYSDLKDLVDVYDTITIRDNITAAMVKSLEEAYTAFLTKYVDPTALRDTLAAHKDLAENIEKIVKVGNAPGQWSSAEAGTAFKALYEEAAAYNKSGIYTTEHNADYAHRLNANAKALYTLANGIKEGKWYRLQFPTEEMFTANSWDEVAGNYNPDKEENQNLFGKYAGLAFAVKYEYKNDNNENISIYEIEPISADTVGIGHSLHFVYDNLLTSAELKDLTKFRFINVGDSAYMLQNKATGLFVRANGTSGAVTLSLQPSLFNTSAIGYGLSFIAAHGLKGANQNYLHAQNSRNTLVTYSADTDIDHLRCSFIIEEAEDVASDFDGTVVNVMMMPGEVRGMCFPMEVTLNENPDAVMWSVGSAEGNKITLVKVDGQKAIAGRPFIIINGDTTLYETATAPVAVKIKHNYSITALEPQNSGLLRGSYDVETVGDSVIVMSGNKFSITKSINATVGKNSAYIATEGGFDTMAEPEIVLDYEAEDGIQAVLEKVSKAGAVYTIDGRLVSRRATLNEISRFGKGLYILNGVKVVVK